MTLHDGHVKEDDALSLIARIKRVVFRELLLEKTALSWEATEDFVETHVHNVEALEPPTPHEKGSEA